MPKKQIKKRPTPTPGVYEVEKIINRREINNNIEYLVLWKAGGDKEWVPENECNCPITVANYLKSIGEWEDECEVEGIIDSIEDPDGDMEYLIKWKDWSIGDSTWVKESDLSSPSILRRFKNGQAYIKPSLLKVSKIHKKKVEDQINYYKVTFDGDDTHNSRWFNEDMVYVMLNGRKALCKFEKKFI